jgi:hypothetical protein
VKRKRGIAQFRGRNSRHSDVDCFAFHVQTVRRYAGSCATQKFIAPRRPVTANNIDLSARPMERFVQVMQQVEKTLVQLTDGTSAMIAEKVIEAIDCIRVVHVSTSIHEIDALVRVQMEEP